MRSPMLPKIHTSIKPDEMEAKSTASTWPTPEHSRDSSAGSNASALMSPAFSLRSHSRCPSSSSSLATSPDSPVNMGKSSLDDLVEEPAEIDDVAHSGSLRSSMQEFCICKLQRADLRRVEFTNRFRRHRILQASAGYVGSIPYASTFNSRMDTR